MSKYTWDFSSIYSMYTIFIDRKKRIDTYILTMNLRGNVKLYYPHVNYKDLGACDTLSQAKKKIINSFTKR